MLRAYARKLQDVDQDLVSLVKQGKVEGFVNNAKNADKLGGLVEDIRDALIGYQVCIVGMNISDTSDFAKDFVTTGYLQQQLSPHCKSHFMAFSPNGLTDR
jgi:hypothetical protein